ncbi:hypothetical protein N0V90_010420 [Kalmusia sp. IMI 367209]|nr:hypothetical protein N0V90_010420 [Kalmusia sp. IMI 367209]
MSKEQVAIGEITMIPSKQIAYEYLPLLPFSRSIDGETLKWELIQLQSKWQAGSTAKPIRYWQMPQIESASTAPMLSRESGGVVDAELKVYGTRNVWVVDTSVILMQVTGHLVPAIYAVAGRAADLTQGAGPTNVGVSIDKDALQYLDPKN